LIRKKREKENIMKLRNLLFGMVIAATMLVALGAKAQPVNLSCIKIEGDGTGPEARVTFVTLPPQNVSLSELF
jgi:DNA/RNA endonuclease YhcR with UshA esterase domain